MIDGKRQARRERSPGNRGADGVSNPRNCSPHRTSSFAMFAKQESCEEKWMATVCQILRASLHIGELVSL